MGFAAFVVLAVSSSAFANSIAPSAYFWPGVLPLTLGLALPASVLAAFLERPFVNRAGVREHTLVYSLQANLFSLIIGYLTLPIAVKAIYIIGPLWSLVALSMSVVSERLYYQRRVLKDRDLRWSYIVWGNLFSSFVLLLLPVAAGALKKAKPNWVTELDPYQELLFWGSVSASVLVFLLSFVRPSSLGLLEPASNRPMQKTTAPS